MALDIHIIKGVTAVFGWHCRRGPSRHWRGGDAEQPEDVRAWGAWGRGLSSLSDRGFPALYFLPENGVSNAFRGSSHPNAQESLKSCLDGGGGGRSDLMG